MPISIAGRLTTGKNDMEREAFQYSSLSIAFETKGLIDSYHYI
jgi:hypothetical protein